MTAVKVEGWIEDGVLRILLPSSVVGMAPSFGSGLSPRQAQVSSMLLAGKQNKEIASDLAITIRAVKHHASEVYRLLGVESREGLAALALARSLHPGDRRPHSVRLKGVHFTAAERELLYCLANGCRTLREVCAKTGMTPSCARTLSYKIGQKVGARKRFWIVDDFKREPVPFARRRRKVA